MVFSTLPSPSPRLTKHPDGSKQSFAKRSLLPLSPNRFWRIEKGFVRTMTWLEDGTVVTLGLWGAGGIVGQTLSTIVPYQIECLSRVEVTPHISDGYPTEVLLAQIQQLEELTVIRSYKRIDTMIIKLLVWLTKRFGQQVEAGQLIDLQLTHQDMAELLSTTRVTVTRLLGQLEQQGLIDRLPLGRIVVKEEELWHYEI